MWTEFYPLISKFVCTFFNLVVNLGIKMTPRSHLSLFECATFLTIYFWEHMPGYTEDIRIHFQFELSVPAPLRDNRGWHDPAPDPATTESDDLMAAQVLFVFTIHISKPTVFHQQNLEITSAYSTWGLCSVNFSITIMTLLFAASFLFHIFSCFAKMQPVDATALWLSVHI